MVQLFKKLVKQHSEQDGLLTDPLSRSPRWGN